MSASVVVLGAVEATTQRNRRARSIRNPSSIAGLILLPLIIAVVIVVPLVIPYSTTDPDFTQPTFSGPTGSHWLGTDNFGRDILTRLAAGGRIDLMIAVVARE